MGESTAVAHGGDPLWRRCLPKTALHRFFPTIMRRRLPLFFSSS
ncbi:hypothetical protein BJP36_39715 [Moorena producens JHB]|uniref:Uncharacterized protein n=1 Tax=Moorena producens (strain JHB) TaxID=1454205 RepID=A0A9Q9SV18_MOOP1|nr:hypothetical protein [Moorena producens]WAN70183.1 hypothetical protein BJP36_39715 [Moorena producens JHB]